MDLLDLTLGTPAENVALDEALLDEAEEGAAPRETLRLWESSKPFVVVGRNSRVAAEVRVETCRDRNIPILRRSSGGCAIVAGPGCLMYAVVLSYDSREHLRLVDEAHRHVLDTMLKGLRPLVPAVARQGTSDLTLEEAKFSGNSMRCRRRSCLYHGTLLYDFPLPLVDECLKMPPRQPDYRQSRPHSNFIANLPTSADELRRAITNIWRAEPANRAWPRSRVQELVADRYSQPAWNLRR
jgi:lipoate---protein ligase